MPFQASEKQKVIYPKESHSSGIQNGSKLTAHGDLPVGRPSSSQEWVDWLKSKANFRYTRTDGSGVGLFAIEEEPFDRLGFSPSATVEIKKIIRGSANHVLFLIWGRAPDKMADDGVQTTCEYEPYQNRENIQYMERMKDYRVEIAHQFERDLRDEYSPGLGQDLTDAMVQLLREEPMIRDFDQGRFVASFKDVMVDGRREFQITEKVLNAAGEVTWKNDFTSEELPQPYNSSLWIRRESTNSK